jgi:hypothetical protein
MKKIILAQWILALALFAPACSDSNGGVEPDCELDSDCPDNWVCDEYSSLCRCINDDGCDAAKSERCMPNGTCQIVTGCVSDADCGGGACHTCNTETTECLCTDDCGCPSGEKCNDNGYCPEESSYSICVPIGTCTHKLQCDAGQICTDGACVDGCEDSGDCPYKWACVDGSCVQGACEDDSYCEFMERCEGSSCVNAYSANAPYCKPCMAAAECGPEGQCAVYPHIDDPFYLAGYRDYCTPACDTDSPCPNGFNCNQAIGVTPDQYCDPIPGSLCANGARCIFQPEADLGYCECGPSNPCPENVCETMLGMCIATGEPCLSSYDCRPLWCQVIQGELFQGTEFSGCVMSSNCGLGEGFHCPLP